MNIMASNQDIKKPQRKADEDLPERLCERGKKPHQKFKPYIVLQYLLKYTDEDNTATAFDIIAFLKEYGLDSDRRSIYKDINEINSVYWMLENDVEIDEAIDTIKADKEGEEKLIVYDRKKKGFYARQLKYELADIILLAECVYATKFISGRDEERLIGVIGDLVSENQKEKIFHDTYTVGRVKTFNKATVSNAHTLYYAMSSDKAKKKVPQKVSFSYLTHDIGNVEKPVERKTKYVVSPYKLLINDGNYYLLAYVNEKQGIKTFRVDRIKNVVLLDQPREGEKVFAALNLKTFTQSHFSMFSGEKANVSLRCISPLLDTMIDRFGTKGVMYSRVDDKHFRVSVDVEISGQFFSWIAGFSTKVVIETPTIAKQYMDFLDKIKSKY